MTEASDRITPPRRGYLWYGLVISGSLLSLFVLLLGLLFNAPDSLPSSATSIGVSVQEQTYLEAIDEFVPEGFPDFHYEKCIYYTRLGGWFSSKESIELVSSAPIAARITFERVGSSPLAPIKIIATEVPPAVAERTVTLCCTFKPPKSFVAFRDSVALIK